MCSADFVFRKYKQGSAFHVSGVLQLAKTGPLSTENFIDSFCIPTTRFRGLEKYTSMSSTIELAVLHFKMSFKRFLVSIIIMRKNLILLWSKALVYYTHTDMNVRVISSSLESCTKMWLVSYDSMLLFQFISVPLVRLSFSIGCWSYSHDRRYFVEL